MSTYILVTGTDGIRNYDSFKRHMNQAVLRIIAEYSDNHLVFVLDGLTSVSKMAERFAHSMRIGIVQCSSKGKDARVEELKRFQLLKSDKHWVAVVFALKGGEENQPLNIRTLKYIYTKTKGDQDNGRNRLQGTQGEEGCGGCGKKSDRRLAQDDHVLYRSSSEQIRIRI